MFMNFLSWKVPLLSNIWPVILYRVSRDLNFPFFLFKEAKFFKNSELFNLVKPRFITSALFLEKFLINRK